MQVYTITPAQMRWLRETLAEAAAYADNDCRQTDCICRRQPADWPPCSQSYTDAIALLDRITETQGRSI